MDEEGKSEGIRIVDRRRFDSEGKERSAEQSDAPASKEGKTEMSTQPKQSISNHTSEAEDDGDISFSSLLMSLATQALMQLGEMSPPTGAQIPQDIEGARQTIEIISMLQRKTKGNLSSEEATLLEEMLHNLRVGYVRVAKSSGKQTST